MHEAMSLRRDVASPIWVRQSVVGASMNVHGMSYLRETYSASARTPSVSVA
jgi:hypothetical protein